MDSRGENEGFRVLDDFVCVAIHAPDIPQAPPNKRGQSAGVRVVVEDLPSTVPIQQSKEDSHSEIEKFIQWCRQPYIDVFNITSNRANELATQYFDPLRTLSAESVMRILGIMRSSITTHCTHGRIREWKRCCIGVAFYLLAGNLDGQSRVGAAGVLVRLSGWSNSCLRFYTAFRPAAVSIATVIWGDNIPYLKIGEEYDAATVRIDESLLDDNGLMTLWQFAEGKQTDRIGAPKKVEETRTFASRVLNFICEHDYEVEIDPEDYQYIKSRFSSHRSRHILYRWSVGSKFVDAIACRIRVAPFDLLEFLSENEFDPDVTYNPDAPTRLAWFKRWKQSPSSPAE